MTLEDLLARGAVTFGRSIDYRNVTIGVMTDSGPVLTPDGEALLNGEAFSASVKPASEKAQRKRKPVDLADVSDAVIKSED